MSTKCNGVVALLSLIVLAACQPDSGSGPGVQRDSSGVAIVESDDQAWENDGWMLADTPSVSIGVTDGPVEYQFTTIIDALRLSDGRIVAANFTRPPDVRLFSPTGEHILTMGGLGAGPGEFQGIMWIDYLPEDTLRVFDFWRARTTYFDLDGDVLAVNPIRVVAGQPVTAFVLIPGLSDGELIARSNSTIPQGAEGRGRFITPILRLDRNGVLLDTLASIPDTEYYVSPAGDRNLVPFGPRATVLPSQDVVYVTTGERYVVDVYDRTGELRRSYRRSALPPTVRPSDLDALMQIELEGARNEEQRQRIERSYRDGPRPERVPAYDRGLLVDAAGNLWAKEYTAPLDSIKSWAVTDAAGRFLGTVAVPLPFRIVDVSEDDVMGVWRDELGVETIRVYELHKAE